MLLSQQILMMGDNMLPAPNNGFNQMLSLSLIIYRSTPSSTKYYFMKWLFFCWYISNLIWPWLRFAYNFSSLEENHIKCDLHMLLNPWHPSKVPCDPWTPDWSLLTQTAPLGAAVCRVVLSLTAGMLLKSCSHSSVFLLCCLHVPSQHCIHSILSNIAELFLSQCIFKNSQQVVCLWRNVVCGSGCVGKVI